MSSLFFVTDGDRRTLTSWRSHKFAFGGIVATLAEMLQSLTGTLDVFPGLSNLTTLGQTATFGSDPLSICSLMADSTFCLLRTSPTTVRTSMGWRVTLTVDQCGC